MTREIDWFKAYEDYLLGMSLYEIGERYNCSHKCVSVNFRKRGLKTRTISEAKTEKIIKSRRLISMEGKRISQSRCVWEYYNGYIPKGYDVHHVDLNPKNDDIMNLKLLSRSEHKKLHGRLKTQDRKI